MATSAAALVCGLMVAVSTAQADDVAPVALTGNLPTTGIGKVVASVDVEASVAAKSRKGAAVPIQWLPTSSVTLAADTYTVRVDPASLPADTIDDDGLATFRVVAFDRNGAAVGLGASSVRAVLGSDGLFEWADPVAPTRALTAAAASSAEVSPLLVGSSRIDAVTARGFTVALTRTLSSCA